MKIFLSIIFLILCIGLMGVVLLQHRKSGGFSGNFGGGGTQMDTSGSWQRMTSMTKVTVIMSICFMVISLVLVKL
ncbi:MAG: preprotein translocase subunit SecG [Synergistaceae bacterium]|nr:preprotein translocase subunit SecG [Synergistaceae bacterium]